MHAQSKRSPVENGSNANGGLSAALVNEENLIPIVRHAFQLGKPDALMHSLRNNVRKTEIEIEELCKEHYGEFILAVEDLRVVLSDADELKGNLSTENLRLQDVATTLLIKLEELLELYAVKKNITKAMIALKTCIEVLNLCSACNKHISDGQFQSALKTLDLIEKVHLQKIPVKAFRRMIDRQMPRIKLHVEKRARDELHDWLIHIRGKAREIGQLSIGQASSMRKRDEQVHSRQREAEEERDSGFEAYVFNLDVEPVDDPFPEFSISPVYQAHCVHLCLGTREKLRDYYYKNRMLQLEQNLQLSSSHTFLESHQPFFAQIAGFFVVEDRVHRTTDGILLDNQIKTMWETALSRIQTILEEQFSLLDTASHFLVIKDYVTLFNAALAKYGYRASPLFEILEKSRDKYHELLLNDCRMQISEVLKHDTYEQMELRKEHEHSMNFAAFGLKSLDESTNFPHMAPFSSSVPEICRDVRNFIEGSISYLSYMGKANFCDVVVQYLDKLLIEVLNDEVMRLVHSGVLSMPQTMQIAANISALEYACDFFLRQVEQYCGIPRQITQKHRFDLMAKAVLKASQNVTYSAVLPFASSKLDECLALMGCVNWIADEPPEHTNDYMNETLISLHDIVSSAQQILPPEALYKVVCGLLRHVADSIVMAFLNESLKRFTVNAVIGFNKDLRVLETFADERFNSAGLHELGKEPTFRDCLAEARQLVDLLLGTQREGIQENRFGALDPKKVAAICEKYKESSDGLFRNLAGRTAKQSARKKSMDALKRRLKDFSS